MGNWDVELEPNKNQVKTELDQARETLRNAAWLGTDAVKELYYKDGYINFHKICELPSAQHEPSGITDEQAIRHLQSTGWMQNHDREMYESGLREKLADDSGSYDSLIPCKDAISRRAVISTIYDNKSDFKNDFAQGFFADRIRELPPVTPKQRTGYWIDTGSGQECSECHEIQYCYDNHRFYCGNCGTKMESEDKE